MTVSVLYKKCNICNEVKGAHLFWRDRTKSDGLDGRCAECRRGKKGPIGKPGISPSWPVCSSCGGQKPPTSFWDDEGPSKHCRKCSPRPKACLECGETKPPEEYRSSPKRSDGLDNRCKPCRNEREAARRNGRGAWLRKCPSCGVRRRPTTFWTDPEGNPSEMCKHCSDPEWKQCNKCAEWRPTTKFRRARSDRGWRDPFVATCEECEAERGQRPPDDQLVMCGTCREMRSAAEFSSAAGTANGLSSSCRRCSRAAALEHIHTGMTVETRDALVEAQGNCCFLCSTPFLNRKTTHLDHDHECPAGHAPHKSCPDCRRAFLCPKCNLSIGQVEKGDLPAMLAYLGYSPEVCSQIAQERRSGALRPVRMRDTLERLQGAQEAAQAA